MGNDEEMIINISVAISGDQSTSEVESRELLSYLPDGKSVPLRIQIDVHQRKAQ